MEIEIAKIKKSYIACYIVVLVMGAVLLLTGALFLIMGLSKTQMQYGVIFLVIGVLLTGIGIGWTVYFARLPKAYITFKEGKFYFWNGMVCSPAEIDYCNVRGGGIDGAIFNYGKLIISVGGKVYKLKFVEDVSNVASQITALKAQAMAVESMQQHIAERKLAEQREAENENKEG